MANSNVLDNDGQPDEGAEMPAPNSSSASSTLGKSKRPCSFYEIWYGFQKKKTCLENTSDSQTCKANVCMDY
jgi:hypothetical protein